MIELGLTNSTYGSGKSELGLTNFYILVGLEWMFDFGLFANVYVTYIHSIDSRVSFDYSDAVSGSLAMERYGSLQPKTGRDFKAVRPGLTIGYAF